MHILRWSQAISVVALMAIAAICLAGEAAHENHSRCGDDIHDGRELREQAALRTYWRDRFASNPENWRHIKLLGFNDFHGQLEPRTVGARPAGGAAVMASYLKAAQQAADDGALIIHAGDHVGASPPISALLQDEPAIEFLNRLGNRHCRARFILNPLCNIVGTLGNHEFDEGKDELLRLLNGGNHSKGPFLDPHYRGADFPYVSANVVDAASGKPLLPPYVIKLVNGVPIGIIGAVLKETPSIVTPSGVAGLKFLDEAESINRYVPELKRRGVRAIVVSIHQGTRQAQYGGPTLPQPQDLGEAIGTIVRKLNSEIDVVISGHAHGFTNQLVANDNGKMILVTQAFSASTAFADIDIAIDPRTRDIVEKSAAIVTTYGDAGPGLHPDPGIAALVAAAGERVAPLVNRLIGNSAAAIARDETAAGESALGNLIADAQRAAMGAQIAFMNPGGIRADLDAGPITWGELFTIQPFGNDLVRMNLSGAQIVALLNQQWLGQPSPRILKTSGISYRWDAAAPVGNRVVVDSIAIGGAPLNQAATYSVVVNSFIAGGGDNFTVLTSGIERTVGPVDLDALVDFVAQLPQPINYMTEGRIERMN